MTVTIVLSKEALEGLFPEGSEARLEIHRKALDMMFKQHIKSSVETMPSVIQQAIKEGAAQAQREIFAQLGIETVNQYSPRYFLNDTGKLAVRAAIKEVIANQTQELMRDEYGPRLERFFSDESLESLSEAVVTKVALNALIQQMAFKLRKYEGGEE